ncbi:hypothetical protein NDU88_004735 [Pleurodeles waltl]|uniref:Secreted protein n=1 Tax=Pleurodeles waltl TaxID=8319 RepID=A0AAV7MZ95_PLEWA|nr:hypothetical protein NDU88_004735 [Pleurodeles waltl]
MLTRARTWASSRLVFLRSGCLCRCADVQAASDESAKRLRRGSDGLCGFQLGFTPPWSSRRAEGQLCAFPSWGAWVEPVQAELQPNE